MATVNDFSILRLNSTAVLITWTAPASDQQNGVITHYELTYTSHNLKEMFSFTTNQFFIYIYSLNATDGYTFKLSAINNMGAGPVVIETLIYEASKLQSLSVTYVCINSSIPTSSQLVIYTFLLTCNLRK